MNNKALNSVLFQGHGKINKLLSDVNSLFVKFLLDDDEDKRLLIIEKRIQVIKIIEDMKVAVNNPVFLRKLKIDEVVG